MLPAQRAPRRAPLRGALVLLAVAATTLAAVEITLAMRYAGAALATTTDPKPASNLCVRTLSIG